VNPEIKKYFFWRTVSAIGDEVWAIAIPIILSTSFTLEEIGQVYSIGAIGTIFGFLFASWVSSKFTDTVGSLICDLIQSITFFTIAICFGFKIILTSKSWYFLFFLIGFFSAIWLALSESMIARLNKDSTNSTQLHKWNFFAGTFGPLLGPVIAGPLISLSSFLILPMLNAISFIGQALQLKRLTSNTKNSEPNDSIAENWLINLNTGLKLIFRNRQLRGVTAIPLIVKVNLLGILPFLTIKLTKYGYSPLITSLTMISFPLGSLLGAFIFGNDRLKYLTFNFNINVYAIIVCVILLGMLYLNSTTIIFILSLILLLSGYVSAQYTIELRSIRQKLVPTHLLSSVVASQSLLVRLVTPISGILFGQVILRNNLVGVFIYGLLIIVALTGLSMINEIDIITESRRPLADSMPSDDLE
jgi:MFS family permease